MTSRFVDAVEVKVEKGEENAMELSMVRVVVELSLIHI